MNVRVKQDYRWNEVRAFGGHEFTKSEWRPVPLGFEAEASAHDLLDIQVEILEPEPVVPEPVQAVKPVVKRKSGGKP